MITMKIFEKVSYDKDADACYISIKKAKVAESQAKNEWLILDKDSNWNLIWIEILSAKKHMSMIDKILLSQEKLEECILF